MNFAKKTLTKNVLTLLLIACTLNLGVGSSVYADAVSTADIYQQMSVSEKRSEVQMFMARDEVRTALSARGVSDADLDTRIANLSDAEILDLHQQIDQLPAGEGILGTVIAILVIFLLLDMGGVTDIFPRV